MSESGGMSVNCLTAGGQNVATDVKENITTLPANLRPTGATTAMNLTWDSDNKLRSADIHANGTADVNFQYDALGRRVARSGTGGSEVYVQMDQQTIADYPVGGAASTPTSRYVYASYIDEPVVRKGPTSTSTAHFYHRNHQYSVTAITTSIGAVAERYAYTAYGQPTILDASGTVLQTSNFSLRTSYTGREWDATLGLHHFRARWMSGLTGRFFTRDPIGYADGKNLYRTYFVPEHTDPNGQTVCKCTSSQWSSGGGGGNISHSTDFRVTGGACSLLDSRTGGPYFGTSTTCSPYGGPLAGIFSNRGSCCNVPNCENRLAEILNIIEHTADPSVLRNSTIASWFGISAHCVTWTNWYLEDEQTFPAYPNTCIKGPKSLVLDVPIAGGPEHSILILTSCDCSGENCKCFGIDNGFFGGPEHVFELPITSAADGTPLPQITIDQINDFPRENAPGCLSKK